MRAGLFGGTFNPIHKGHLMVAEQSLQRLPLDCLYIIPCRVPPHKFPAYLAPAKHRLHMIELALPDDARYRLSDIELQRNGPSYTIDTVRQFQARILPGADLYLIVGMDAFLEIHTWKHYRQLLEIARLVVLPRLINDRMSTGGDIPRLDDYIRSTLSSNYGYDHQQTCWRQTEGACIHLLPITPLQISSSQVRQRIRAGKAIADLVPRKVIAYIEKKELYR